MKGMMPAVFLFLTAGFTMLTTDAGAQDKKDKKDEKWPDRVTVRQWIPSQKEFIKPKEDVKAKFRVVDKDRVTVRLESASVPNIPTVGTEIIDQKDKTTWVVTKVAEGTEFQLCDVVKKDPPKKD